MGALLFSFALLVPDARASHDDDFFARLYGPDQSFSLGEARFTWRGASEVSYSISLQTNENITSGYLYCGTPPTGVPVAGLFSRTASTTGSVSLSGKLQGSGSVYATSTGCTERIRRLGDVQDAMEAGLIYLELRSTQRPEGAVRGQITLASGTANPSVPLVSRDDREAWDILVEIERLLDRLRSLVS